MFGKLSLRQHVFCVLTMALVSGLPAGAFAHGSVVDGGEGCTIRMDFYSAHFTVFQPQTRGHRAFCEDLPDVTDTVFVLAYRHDSLRQVPIEFRIIRNTTGLGRFVRWQDIDATGELAALTVFHQQVAPRPDGVLTVLHSFAEAGNYVGIVTAPHPTLDPVYRAVFPFRVGRPLWQSPWILIALAALAVMLLYWLKARRHNSVYRRSA